MNTFNPSKNIPKKQTSDASYFNKFSDIFNNIYNINYIIIYTICLIFFLKLIPTNILNNYAFVIITITIFLAGIFFYKGLQTETNSENGNINLYYERIKTVILFLCFITISIMFYSVDPGGIIHQYYNYYSFLTILLFTFGLLYLIVILTFPFFMNNNNNNSNLPWMITDFSLYGSIIFIFIITTLIYLYPKGFILHDKLAESLAISCMLFFSILWSILLITNLFKNINQKSNINSNFNLIKSTFLLLFGSTSLVILVLTLLGRQNLTSLFIIVIIILLLLYTLQNKLTTTSSQSSQTFGYLNIIAEKIYNFKILFATIILFLLYYKFKNVKDLFTSERGKILIDTPIPINNTKMLSTYESLNDTSDPKYQYAISLWVFIESSPPNMNTQYQKYASILNYGDKPNILYKAETNTLMITMKQKSTNPLLDFDDNENRIIYTNHNFLLQKWNNIIINYNGGTLDVFLNGELVNSSVEVIPYINLDSLTVGTENGIKGGICNVVYYKKNLTMNNIYNIYHSMKNKRPLA